MSDDLTRYLHVTVYCPSCGHRVDLGAYEAQLDLDLQMMTVTGSFVGGHRCTPPEPEDERHRVLDDIDWCAEDDLQYLQYLRADDQEGDQS
jgi:hypothetical protein